MRQLDVSSLFSRSVRDVVECRVSCEPILPKVLARSKPKEMLVLGFTVKCRSGLVKGSEEDGDRHGFVLKQSNIIALEVQVTATVPFQRWIASRRIGCCRV